LGELTYYQVLVRLVLEEKKNKLLPGSKLVFNREFRVRARVCACACVRMRAYACACEGMRFAGLGVGFGFISHLEPIWGGFSGLVGVRYLRVYEAASEGVYLRFWTPRERREA
jgi:hypothetical protein